VSVLTLSPSPESTPFGQPATLRASLADLSQSPATPITGASVTLAVAGGSCLATTDSSGNAACPVTPSGGPGLVWATGSYAGDATHTPASAKNPFELAGVGYVPIPVTMGIPVNIAPPAITGSAKAKHNLTCSTGAWSNAPTRFTYQWNRDGTPIAGATSNTQTVQTLDEGSTLTCSVTAANALGLSQPATSSGVKVAVPHIKGCPAAAGTVHAMRLGLVSLGMSPKRARRAYRRSSNRGKRYEDFFCLTPIGVRVGYGSPAIVKGLSRKTAKRLSGHVVWISSANPIFAIDTIRPGATLTAAEAALPKGNLFGIGLNTWYLARLGAVTAIFKTRYGLVEEIGIADRRVTGTKLAERRFLTSFS
jgi:hypothetical protein